MKTLIRTSFVLILVGVLAGQRAHTARAASPETDEVVAKVGDRVITLDELDRRWGEVDAASRAEMRQQTYDARRRVLDDMIGEVLIGLEAKARGISVNQLLEIEIPKRMRPIVADDIAAVYQDLGDRAQGATLAELTPAIRQYLEQARPVEARQRFIVELRRNASGIHVSLEPPRLEVTTAASDPAWGPAVAPVEIVEFSDFQCPFCRQVEPTLEKLRSTFGDRIRLVFKDFPLDIHPDAFPAAEAGQCAREQGKFWEYHDLLFANQEALDRESLKRYAAKLGLDLVAFNACLDESRFKYLVQADIDESRRYGLVTATPTFFVNGRFLSGALSFEAFDEMIREELERQVLTPKP